MKIGILGGGQLGRMLALAGYPLGLHFRLLDSSPDACAGQVAELMTGNLRDEALLQQFAGGLDLVTYEWENVSVETAALLASKLPLWPPGAALEASQDRLIEKTLFNRLGIETALFVPVDSSSQLANAVNEIGLPAVLKTRRMGYDGLGQWRLRNDGDVEQAARELDAPAILEGFVSFDRELSVIAVRSTTGETSFYPLVENHHGGGILRLSLAPAPGLTPELQTAAEDIARRLLDELGYVGVLAIELFQAGDRLLANEMAPRVHNSGHWTIDGAETSQFENHLRAITGMALGSSAPIGHSAMINLIGETPSVETLATLDGVHVHLYGKSPRPGRKLGHLNFRDDDPARLGERVAKVASKLAISLG
jgi:5-(carboxyamino)imidazole ribonucleotide synthase